MYKVLFYLIRMTISLWKVIIDVSSNRMRSCITNSDLSIALWWKDLFESFCTCFFYLISQNVLIIVISIYWFWALLHELYSLPFTLSLCDIIHDQVNILLVLRCNLKVQLRCLVCSLVKLLSLVNNLITILSLLFNDCCLHFLIWVFTSFVLMSSWSIDWLISMCCLLIKISWRFILVALTYFFYFSSYVWIWQYLWPILSWVNIYLLWTFNDNVCMVKIKTL